MNAQSAMEYLVTYGWAILLIAFVVGILFKLGVFSTNTFVSRAQPGSCHVSRPYGPNTTQLISLVGDCNNQVPQYVDTFSGTGSYFDIENNLSNIGGTNTVTVTEWAYLSLFDPNDIRANLISIKGDQHCGMFLAVNDSMHTVEYGLDIKGVSNPPFGNEVHVFAANNLINAGQWYFYAAVYNGVAQDIYLNGTLVYTAPLNGIIDPCSGDSHIGSGSGNTGSLHNLHGSASNVQVYSTALSAANIQQLYIEGIGGVPINLQNLIAWWPLNGNANDYSGNSNNGGPTNVIYSSQWTNGYTIP